MKLVKKEKKEKGLKVWNIDQKSSGKDGRLIKVAIEGKDVVAIKEGGVIVETNVV